MLKNPVCLGSNMSTKILIIYTGGTIGMAEDASGTLIPVDFTDLERFVPEIKRFDYSISTKSFKKPIDSSNVDVSTWVKLAGFIRDDYNNYDGFVVLHGTDTMAYSASALSFLLENLGKPVIFTGSQLPIGKIRTDGRENLISAIEIAASLKEKKSELREVTIFFDNNLYRGNRTHKYSTEDFAAMESANYPVLAKVGVHVFYKNHLMFEPLGEELIVHEEMERQVAVIKVFPGMTEAYVKSVLSIDGLKGVVIETFGSGNTPTSTWFSNALKKAIDQGIKIINVTQCNKGFVEQGRYQTSSQLLRAGVIGGADMTTEGALTKMMYLLSVDGIDFEHSMAISLRGELTWFSSLD